MHYAYTGLIQDPHNNPNYINVTDFNYPYPIHADEWMHLAQAIYIMDTGTLGFVNPYSPDLQYHNDMELGYHVFLAAFFTISGIDPVLGYQYLPALFFVVNALLLFLFVRRFTKNYYIALLSIFFFLVVPSNTNILGNWFATPLTFSVFMIYAFFISFESFMESRRWRHLPCPVLIYAASAVTSPFAAILISIVTSLYLLTRVNFHRKGFLRNNLLQVSGSAGLIFILLMIFVNFPSVFTRSWTSFQYDYSLTFFYGLLPTSLALLGILLAVERKMNPVFVIWPAVFLLNLLFYMITGSGIFFPYERTVYYFMVGLAPLAAMGLYSILRKTYDEVVARFRNHYKKYISLALAGIILLGIMVVSFQGYYEINERELVLLHLINNQDYNAIKFVGDAYDLGNIVLADSLLSIAVYPISRNHVVSIMSSNLGFGDSSTFSRFVSGSYSEKQRILKEVNADFVISQNPMNYDFLEEVYRRRDYVYRVNL